MGLGDKLSKLFRGEKEFRAEDEIKTADGKELPDAENTEDSQIQRSKAGVSDNTSQAGTETADSVSDATPVTKEKVLEVMSDIYDPEIPVDIVNLGLVYDVNVENRKVHVKMTLTSPGCPTAGEMVHEAQMLIEEIPGVEEAIIEVVWDPPWDPSKMSEEARQALGFM